MNNKCKYYRAPVLINLSPFIREQEHGLLGMLYYRVPESVTGVDIADDLQAMYGGIAEANWAVYEITDPVEINWLESLESFRFKTVDKGGAYERNTA